MASKAAAIAVPKEVKLKAPKDFSIVRNSKKNTEGLKVVTGKPLFGMDYRVDGMLIAMIQHPPAFGMKLKSFDATAAKKMPESKMYLALNCTMMVLNKAVSIPVLSTK